MVSNSKFDPRRRAARDKKIAFGIVAGALLSAALASAFALIAPTLPQAKDAKSNEERALAGFWAMDNAVELQAAVENAAAAAQKADEAALEAGDALARARLVESQPSAQRVSLANGAVYVGEAVSGAPHGVGVKRLGAAITAGSFVKGARNGPGVECAAANCEGPSYFGDFREDAPSGSGRMQLPDGSVYRGEIRAGAPHGFGELKRLDGSVYRGGFKEGAREGYGVDRTADGTPSAGFWVNDALATSPRS